MESTLSERELVPLPRMLDAAASRGACLTAFDSGGGRPEFVQATLAACRDLEAPALFLGWSGAAKSFGFRPLVAMVRSLAAEAGVPAGLHLDHAEDEADVRAAIDAGFSSVMFDGAEMPLDENIEATKRLVEYARERGSAASGARAGGVGGAAETRANSPTPLRPSASPLRRAWRSSPPPWAIATVSRATPSRSTGRSSRIWAVASACRWRFTGAPE